MKEGKPWLIMLLHIKPVFKKNSFVKQQSSVQSVVTQRLNHFGQVSVFIIIIITVKRLSVHWYVRCCQIRCRLRGLEPSHLWRGISQAGP